MRQNKDKKLSFSDSKRWFLRVKHSKNVLQSAIFSLAWEGLRGDYIQDVVTTDLPKSRGIPEFLIIHLENHGFLKKKNVSFILMTQFWQFSIQLNDVRIDFQEKSGHSQKMTISSTAKQVSDPCTNKVLSSHQLVHTDQ